MWGNRQGGCGLGRIEWIDTAARRGKAAAALSNDGRRNAEYVHRWFEPAASCPSSGPHSRAIGEKTKW